MRFGEVLEVGFNPGKTLLNVLHILPKVIDVVFRVLPKVVDVVFRVLPKVVDVVFKVLLQIPAHAPKRNNVGNTNPEDR